MDKSNKRMVEEIQVRHKRHRVSESMNLDTFSDHEKRHLISTNNEMAEFVRRSVAVIQLQSSEIERLHKIINNQK